MSQKAHIQFTLMIPHEHRRPCLPQPILLVFNLKPHAGGEVHAPLEGARGGPLAEAAVAGEVEAGGGEGAVGGAEEEGEEGGEAAAVEFERVLVCESAEDGEELGDGEDDERGEEEGEEDGVHACWTGCGREYISMSLGDAQKTSVLALAWACTPSLRCGVRIFK